MDESGNFDFSHKGSDHFVLSAMYTTQPCRSASVMQSLKYEQMARRSTDIEFHATNNSKGTRKRVIDSIGQLEDVIKVHSLWIDKHYAHPCKHDPVELFSLFGAAMGKWVLKMFGGKHRQVILIFDSALTAKQCKAFQARIKPQLKMLKAEYQMLIHPVKADLNGQIADYFSWAKFRSLERGDTEAETALQERIDWTDFDLFRYGMKRYW